MTGTTTPSGIQKVREGDQPSDALSKNDGAQGPDPRNEEGMSMFPYNDISTCGKYESSAGLR